MPYPRPPMRDSAFTRFERMAELWRALHRSRTGRGRLVWFYPVPGTDIPTIVCSL